MAPLATTADLTARGIVVTDAARATLYLDVAGTAVRDAAGSPIGSLVSTVSIYPDGSVWLRLPGGVVTAVASVALDGVELIEGTDWRLIDGMLWRPCGWSSALELPGPVTVTYTHGLPTVPADIVDLVCRMAASALVLSSAEADGTGLAVDDVVSESLGDYSVTYRADTGTTEMDLSDRLRSRLRARFGGGAAMVTAR